MIKSFKCKETERIFHREYSKKLPQSIQRTALKKLWMISAACTIGDLSVPPSNRIEKLKGDMNGKYSIRVNDQWRICFEFEKGDAYNVEIIDYHYLI